MRLLGACLPILLLAVPLAACGTDAADGTNSPIDCARFTTAEYRALAGITVDVDLGSLDYAAILGIPLFVPGAGVQNDPPAMMLAVGVFRTPAVLWQGEEGKAVMLNGGDNHCAWAKGL